MDTVKTYINALFDSAKGNGALTGRRQISDSIGISNKDCDKIHNMLKKMNLIKVNNMKTYPCMDKDSMINAIIGNHGNKSIAGNRIGF